MINRCCNKKITFTNNFFFKFKEDDTPIGEFILAYAKSPHCCAVNMINKQTKNALAKIGEMRSTQKTREVEKILAEARKICFENT